MSPMDATCHFNKSSDITCHFSDAIMNSIVTSLVIEINLVMSLCHSSDVISLCAVLMTLHVTLVLPFVILINLMTSFISVNVTSL